MLYVFITIVIAVFLLIVCYKYARFERKRYEHNGIGCSYIAIIYEELRQKINSLEVRMLAICLSMLGWILGATILHNIGVINDNMTSDPFLTFIVAVVFGVPVLLFYGLAVATAQHLENQMSKIDIIIMFDKLIAEAENLGNKEQAMILLKEAITNGTSRIDHPAVSILNSKLL